MMNAIARHDRRDQFALPDDGTDYLTACSEPLAVTRGGAPVRVAWSADLGFAPVEPETRKIAEAAARAFAEIGLEVEEASPDLGDPGMILKTLYGGAQAGAHAARSPEQKAQMDPELVQYAEASAGMSVVEYVRAVAARQALVDTLRRFFERYDLLLTPTLCLPAFPLGLVGPREVAGRAVTHLGWTLCYPFNYSGQPAVSVPAGWTAQRSAGRAPDRRPAPRGRAGAARRGGIRGAPPLGHAAAAGNLAAWLPSQPGARDHVHPQLVDDFSGRAVKVSSTTL